MRRISSRYMPRMARRASPPLAAASWPFGERVSALTARQVPRDPPQSRAPRPASSASLVFIVLFHRFRTSPSARHGRCAAAGERARRRPCRHGGSSVGGDARWPDRSGRPRRITVPAPMASPTLTRVPEGCARKWSRKCARMLEHYHRHDRRPAPTSLKNVTGARRGRMGPASRLRRAIADPRVPAAGKAAGPRSDNQRAAHRPASNEARRRSRPSSGTSRNIARGHAARTHQGHHGAVGSGTARRLAGCTVAPPGRSRAPVSRWPTRSASGRAR